MMTDGKDIKGRFTKGNKLGRGNPMGKKCEVLRIALYNAVSPDDIHTIIEQLKDQAIGGNLKGDRYFA